MGHYEDTSLHCLLTRGTENVQRAPSPAFEDHFHGGGALPRIYGKKREGNRAWKLLCCGHVSYSLNS